MAVVIAANRTRHPLDARTLARLAAQYVDRGVVGFGLSNDERRGSTADFAGAFAIAERAGLTLVPHGGELLGPESVRTCLDALHADRLGHGVRSAEDPELLARIVDAGVALEVCPVSNVSLGVYSDPGSVPLPELMAAGATIALGADDPLLFGTRLAGQYATVRAAHDLSDSQLAHLACLVRGQPRLGGPAPAVAGRGRRLARDRRLTRPAGVGPGPAWESHHVSDPNNPYGNSSPDQPAWGQSPEPTAPYGQQPPYGQPQPPAYGHQPGQPQPGHYQPQQPPYAQPNHGYGGYAPPPPQDGQALAAMIVGIVSLVLACGYGIGLLGSPVALFLGRASMKRIDASHGQLSGRGMAQAGFILGIIGTVLLVLTLILVVVLIVAFIQTGGFDSTTYESNV